MDAGGGRGEHHLRFNFVVAVLVLAFDSQIIYESIQLLFERVDLSINLFHLGIVRLLSGALVALGMLSSSNVGYKSASIIVQHMLYSSYNIYNRGAGIKESLLIVRVQLLGGGAIIANDVFIVC